MQYYSRLVGGGHFYQIKFKQTLRWDWRWLYFCFKKNPVSELTIMLTLRHTFIIPWNQQNAIYNDASTLRIIFIVLSYFIIGFNHKYFLFKIKFLPLRIVCSKNRFFLRICFYPRRTKPIPKGYVIVKRRINGKSIKFRVTKRGSENK